MRAETQVYRKWGYVEVRCISKNPPKECQKIFKMIEPNFIDDFYNYKLTVTIHNEQRHIPLSQLVGSGLFMLGVGFILYSL